VKLHTVDKIILKNLYSKAMWIKSFGAARSRLDILIKQGYVKQITPPNGKARNMVEITPKGSEIFEGLRA
jgi:hypothetical protein